MMLMWRRLLPPFTWLVKPSVGSRQGHNFPRYNCLWEGAEMGLVDLLYKKSHWKQTNKWKVWGKTLTWGAPHGHPEESRENTSRKEARKTCHLLQSRTWSTLEAQNFHSEDVEKVVRSQPAEQKFSEKKKKSHVQRLTFIHGILAVFPYRPWDKHHQLPTAPMGFFFFFLLPSFVFLKTVSPAGVGNGKPFSRVLWACLLIYGFTTSPGLSWNWKPWVQRWEMKSDTKFIHFPQSDSFSSPFTCSVIHILIYFDHKHSCSLIPEREGSFLTTGAQSSSPSFFRTHMSHRHTCTSPHAFFSPSRLSQGGFLDQAPGLLSAPTRSGSRHNLHLVVLVVSIQGCGCRRWKRQVYNPFLD